MSYFCLPQLTSVGVEGADPLYALGAQAADASLTTSPGPSTDVSVGPLLDRASPRLVSVSFSIDLQSARARS